MNKPKKHVMRAKDAAKFFQGVANGLRGLGYEDKGLRNHASLRGIEVGEALLHDYFSGAAPGLDIQEYIGEGLAKTVADYNSEE